MELCSVCRIERENVVYGPGLCICERCVAEIDGAQPPQGVDGTCSFCLQPERRSRFAFRNRSIVAAAAGGDVRVCSECMPILRRIIDFNRKQLASRS